MIPTMLLSRGEPPAAWLERLREIVTLLGRCVALGRVALVALLAIAGCGGSMGDTGRTAIPAALLRQSRPIGHGAKFHPPARGPVGGRCSPRLGRRAGTHVEVFAADRVVIVAAGIGVRGPLSFSAGRISHARCYGDLVTLEPTGVVLARPGRQLHLSDLFRAWGLALSARRLAGFSAPAGGHVIVFVDGRPWHGEPGSVPLARHSEIVLEVGPYVPPHSTYTFPPGT